MRTCLRGTDDHVYRVRRAICAVSERCSHKRNEILNAWRDLLHGISAVQRLPPRQRLCTISISNATPHIPRPEDNTVSK